MEEEGSRLRDWTDWMLTELQETINGAERNGHPIERLPHNLNVYVPGVESRAVILELRDLVALSTGSACTTAIVEPSHVISALRLGEDRSYSSIRIGLGRFNTWEQVELVTYQLVSTIRILRKRFGKVHSSVK